jgi:hypothetical protein
MPGSARRSDSLPAKHDGTAALQRGIHPKAGQSPAVRFIAGEV